MSTSAQSFSSAVKAEVARVLGRLQVGVVAAAFVAAAVSMFFVIMGFMRFEAAELGDPSAIASASVFPGFGIPLAIVSFGMGIYCSAMAALDYADGAMSASLLLAPKRNRLFFARLVPWLLLAAAVSSVSFAIVLATSLNDITDLAFSVSQMILSVACCVLTTVMAYCCAASTQRGVFSVCLFITLQLVAPLGFDTLCNFGPEFLRAAAETLSVVMPGVAFPAIVSLPDIANGAEPMRILVSTASTAVWTLGFPMLSLWLFRERAGLN